MASRLDPGPLGCLLCSVRGLMTNHSLPLSLSLLLPSLSPSRSLSLALALALSVSLVTRQCVARTEGYSIISIVRNECCFSSLHKVARTCRAMCLPIESINVEFAKAQSLRRCQCFILVSLSVCMYVSWSVMSACLNGTGDEFFAQSRGSRQLVIMLHLPDCQSFTFPMLFVVCPQRKLPSATYPGNRKIH